MINVGATFIREVRVIFECIPPKEFQIVVTLTRALYVVNFFWKLVKIPKSYQKFLRNSQLLPFRIRRMKKRSNGQISIRIPLELDTKPSYLNVFELKTRSDFGPSHFLSLHYITYIKAS